MPHHCNMASFSFIDWNDFNKTSQSHDEQTLMTNGSEKTGLNLKQKSDPNRNPSQFPIIFLRSTCYFLLLLYLFLGRYRVNKSELRFSTSHVTPFMRFIESRLSWLAGFLPSEHLVFCNHILLAFSRTHDETKTEKTVWIPTSKQEWDEKSTFL